MSFGPNRDIRNVDGADENAVNDETKRKPHKTWNFRSPGLR